MAKGPKNPGGQSPGSGAGGSKGPGNKGSKGGSRPAGPEGRAEGAEEAVRDHDRPGAGLPWRTRPRRRPRPVEPVITHRPGRPASANERRRPGFLVAVIEDPGEGQ